MPTTKLSVHARPSASVPSPEDGDGVLDGTARHEIRSLLRNCASVGGEVAARARAVSLGNFYQALDPAGRHEFLRVLAVEFGPDPKAVEIAHTVYQSLAATHLRWDAEGALRASLRSARMRILTQFNALPQGVKFLVDLRAELLALLADEPHFAALDRELEEQFISWFDVGFLELRRITWSSPAALLEKLIQYEAVHEIKSWRDMRARLASDRRCYALFHPRMPEEPLIFVEVALTQRVVHSIHALLDEERRPVNLDAVDTAMFYSISNTQKGLRGVHFGNFLLNGVIEDLRAEFPRLRTFATLSPMPRFKSWVDKQLWKTCPEVIEQSVPGLPEASILLKLAAHYLCNVKDNGRPADPVARFHLGNGACIGRLNWMADTSNKGMAQSYGIMVNYLYDLDQIETNAEEYARTGLVAASPEVLKVQLEPHAQAEA